MEKPASKITPSVLLLIWFLLQGLILNIAEIFLAMKWGCGTFEFLSYDGMVDYRSPHPLATPAYFLAVIFFTATNYQLMKRILQAAPGSFNPARLGAWCFAFILAMIEEAFLFSHIMIAPGDNATLWYFLLTTLNYLAIAKICAAKFPRFRSKSLMGILAFALAVFEGSLILYGRPLWDGLDVYMVVETLICFLLAALNYLMIGKIRGARCEQAGPKRGMAIAAFMLVLVAGSAYFGGTSLSFQSSQNPIGGYAWNWLGVKWSPFGDCN